MKDISIPRRLFRAFAAILLLIALAALVSALGLGRVTANYEEALDAYVYRAMAGMEFRAALLDQVTAQKNYLLRGEPEHLASARRQALRVRALRAALRTSVSDGADETLIRQIADATDLLNATFEDSVGIRGDGDIEAADRAMRGKAAAAVDLTNRFITHARREASSARANASKMLRRTVVVTFVLMACIALGAAAISVVVARSITRPLKRLQSQIDALGRAGILPAEPAVSGQNEIAAVARAFHEMVQKAALIRELESKGKRLAALSSRVTDAQEDERGRIARGLHDGLGQALTAMKLDLGAALRSLERGGDARQHLTQAQGLIDTSLDSLHRLVYDLRPPALDNLGLVAALEANARDVQGRWGIEVQVAAHGLEQRLPPAMETALYRICQEALTNIAKHSRAGRAEVRLEPHPERVDLTVSDDGVGFDLDGAMQGDDAHLGVGLLSMERRAETLGGTFRIETAPGRGTTLRVSLPRAVQDQS